MIHQIVLTTSNEYTYSCFVTIASLIKSSSSNNDYKINILVGSEFTSGNQDLLSRSIHGKQNFEISFIDMDERYPNCAREFYTDGYINRNTYFRYYIPDLFPEESFVLYLDSDLVICDDVAKLFVFDIGNHWLACCKNVSCIYNYTKNNKLKNGDYYRTYYENLGITDISMYSQTGLILFNIPELKKHSVMQRLIEHSANTGTVFFDQDTINLICQNKIAYFDLAWNHVWYYSDINYLMDGLSPELYQAYANARIHPKVVHYAGPKPWVYPERILGGYFWRIAYEEKDVLRWFVKQGFCERKLIDNALSLHEYISAVSQHMKGIPSEQMSLLQEEMKSDLKQFDFSPISPIFGDNSINICFSSSEEYAPFVSVVIQSILENRNPIDLYDIVICTADMTPRTQYLLQFMTKGVENVSIRFCNIQRLVEDIAFYTWAHFTPNTYYRLLIPEIFAKYDKVLYFDSDVVVCDDIATLFRTEIADGFLFAAARDTHVESYCACGNVEFIDNCRSLGLAEGDPYFQCGVSLFNIQAMREAFPDNFLVKDASANQYTWMDQDLLNKRCRGRIQQLPNRWNIMVLNDEIESERFLPQPLLDEYFLARQNPGIIHYVGRSIPFFRPEIDLAELYWPYARKTPFYEILLKKMQFDVCNYMLDERSISKKLKKIVKAIVLAPIGLFAPKGSKLREKLKKQYSKLRGR